MPGGEPLKTLTSDSYSHSFIKQVFSGKLLCIKHCGSGNKEQHLLSKGGSMRKPDYKS